VERRLAYVVHKHRASRLHYDFRLEWRGVLLSWAVPKGPSLDPRVKRLALRVEDHPRAYAAFEGVIPAGEYGGGTVMVWDRGTWRPEVADVDAALARGDLKFTLRGRKLGGSWALVRTRPSAAAGGRAGWLLLKHRDAWAAEEDVTTTQPRSAASGRLLAEIAFEGGGDVGRAAEGDPPEALRRLVRAARVRRGAGGARDARRARTPRG
jgi:bifunctional non-homologous end joining protein LigD